MVILYPRMALRVKLEQGVRFYNHWAVDFFKNIASPERDQYFIKLLNTKSDELKSTSLFSTLLDICDALSERHKQEVAEALQSYVADATNYSKPYNNAIDMPSAFCPRIKVIALLNKCANLNYRWTKETQSVFKPRDYDSYREGAIYLEVLSALKSSGLIMGSVELNTNTVFLYSDKVRDKLADFSSQMSSAPTNAFYSNRKLLTKISFVNKGIPSPIIFTYNNPYYLHIEYATLRVSLYHAPVWAEYYLFKLRKINEESWIIVDIHLTGVS